MKFHRQLWLIVITAITVLTLSVYAGTPEPLQAQGGSQVIVYSAQTKISDDKKSLNLNVVFGLVDPTGGASTDNPSKAVDVLLDSGSGATPQKSSYPVSQVQLPLNVEVAVDLSGSMGRIISSWNAPLATFVGGLDQTTQVGFLGFNETVPLIDQPLSASRQDLLATIKDKLKPPPGNSGTCIYDALYAAIDHVRTDTTKRRAVILITDGKDAPYGKSAQCSKHSLDDVAKHAFDPADFLYRTPIYIIGIQNPLAQGDLDQPSLKSIATGAAGMFIPVSGTALDVSIGSAFSNILLALKNQWQVQVPISGAPGDWKATLTVSLPNGIALNPVVVSFKVAASDVAAVSTPTATPSMTPSPELTINAVGLNPDDPSQLLIDVTMTGDAGVVSYIVTITDNNTNTEVQRERLNPPLPSRVPLKITGMKPDGSYTVVITAADKSDQVITRSQPYGMKYLPPPTSTPGPTPTPTPVTTSDTLRQNAPILLPVVGIVAIVLIGLLFFVLRSSRPKAEPGWQSDLTGVVMRGGSGQQDAQHIYQTPPQQAQGINEFTNPVPLLIRPPAAITITQSRDKALVLGQQFDIQETPFRIGREGPDLKILGDDRVSRRHAIIDYGPSGYFVEDQGSTHGTFVNGQRVQGRSPLVDGAEVGIGPGTILTFSIASSPRDMDRTNAVPLTPLDRN